MCQIRSLFEILCDIFLFFKISKTPLDSMTAKQIPLDLETITLDPKHLAHLKDLTGAVSKLP